MKNIFFLILFLSFLQGTQAQTQKIYYIGHSLTNLDIPFMVQQMADAANKPADYRHHINIGAPLSLQWSEPWKFNGDLHWVVSENREREFGTDFLVELANGSYTALVLTEAQAFQSNLYWNDGIGHGQKFDSVAVQASPNIRTYCYETWSHVENNDFVAWRQRINQDLPFWKMMAQGIRSDGLIVPAGQAMAALYDTLQVGNLGQLTDISQIFSDNIHLNNTGNYFVALVMYATLFKTSPEGLPAIGAGPYQQGTLVETDAITRLALQRLVWEVVRSFPLSDVVVNTKEAPINKGILYPNPTTGQVVFENIESILSINLLDAQGRFIQSLPIQPNLDISAVPTGVYFFLIKKKEGQYALKIVKK